MKKGYAVLLDSLIAMTFTILVLTSLMGMRHTNQSLSDMSIRKLHYASEDALDVLNKYGALDEIGEEWAAANGNTSDPHFINASNMSVRYLDQLLPPNIGYTLTIDDDSIANSTRLPLSGSTAMTHSTRLLVGYGKGLPTKGNVARALLTNIKEKETSSYAYFGGFVGQGNITSYIRDIPADATLLRACLELNTPSDFDLYINGLYSKSFAPTTGNMSANLYEPGSGCLPAAELAKITPGAENRFDIFFTEGNVTSHYIGGGFIHVVYSTTEMDTDEGAQTGRYYYPGIAGIANLYDSMYVPGQLQTLEANLHFKANYTTFLYLGNFGIYNTTANESEQTVTLSDAYLRGRGLIYNPDMSQQNVPLRWGTSTFSSTSTGGGIADIAFVVDSTGSMADEINDVYSIIGDFVDTLKNSSIDYRLALVEHKDYVGSPCGSAGDFASKVHKFAEYMVTIDTAADWAPGNMTNITAASGIISLSQNGTTATQSLDITQTTDSNSLTLYGGRLATQSFRPEKGGPLATVTVRAARTGNPPPLYLEVRDTNGNLPGPTLLATGEVTFPAGAARNVNITLAAPPTLTAGANYALVLKAKGNGGTGSAYYTLRIGYLNPTSPYPNGMLYYSSTNGSSWSIYTAYDLYLQTFMLSPPFASSGEYVLEHDLGETVDWYMSNSSAIVPAGTSINMTFRVSDDRATWTAWNKNLTVAGPGRYIQTRVFMTSNGQKSPSVDWIQLASFANVDFTRDHFEFKKHVNAMTASGGNDIPESHLKALNDTVSLGWRPEADRYIIMLTDAPPHAVDCPSVYGYPSGMGTNISCHPAPKTVAEMIPRLVDNDMMFFLINRADGLCNNHIMDVNMTNATGGKYYDYTTAGGVKNVLMDVVNNIINLTYAGQNVMAEGKYSTMYVYPDSYLQYTYDPINETFYGQVSLRLQTDRFADTTNCRGAISVPAGVVVSDAKVTSYSGSHWTDLLTVDGFTVFDLATWSNDYPILGDPYIVNIPASRVLTAHNNSIVLTTGDNPSTPTSCSADNRAIYTVRIPTMTAYGDVYKSSIGCNWKVEFEDGSFYESPLPISYAGNHNCTYTSTSISYDPDDSVDDAVYRLFYQLDLNRNGKVDLLFDPTMINIEIGEATGIQSLWGPARFKLIVWI
jgi:hypothetical protein